MSLLMTIAVLAALLGSALVAGVFFAFSSFIMQALARLPSPEGIAAMKSINVVVLNASFLGTFLGTALISALIAVLAVMAWDTPAAPWLFAGAISYFVGTFLVTGLGNVPLNDQLAAVSTTDPGAIPLWQHYLNRWTLLNTIRTIAATAATLAFSAGLLIGKG